MNDSPLERLKRFDEERPSLPGEHWIALSTGLWLLTKSHGSLLGRLAGAALVYRAASGRDGIARMLATTPLGRRLKQLTGGRPSSARYIDIAAPWPYKERVRVPAISQPVGKTMWTP